MATSRKNFKVRDNLDVAGTGASTIAGSLAVGTGLTVNGKNVATVDMLGQSGSGITWLTITGQNVNPAVTNTGYLMETGGTLRTITLPANVPQGFYLPVKAIGAQVRIIANGNTIVEVGVGNNLLLDDGDVVVLVSTAAGTLRILQGGSQAVQDLSYFDNPTIEDANLTGVPTAPTATAGTNSNQLATTAFVVAAMAGAGSSKWTVLRANATLEVGKKYLSLGNLTHTLPAGVAEGETVIVHSKSSTLLLKNGNNITGVPSGDDLRLNAGDTVELVASDLNVLEIV